MARNINTDRSGINAQSDNEIGAFLKSLLTCEYELGVAITNLRSISVLAVVNLAEEDVVA